MNIGLERTEMWMYRIRILRIIIPTTDRPWYTSFVAHWKFVDASLRYERVGGTRQRQNHHHHSCVIDLGNLRNIGKCSEPTYNTCIVYMVWLYLYYWSFYAVCKFPTKMLFLENFVDFMSYFAMPIWLFHDCSHTCYVKLYFSNGISNKICKWLPATLNVHTSLNFY